MTYITHQLNYRDEEVCEDCGSNEWHVNLFYKNTIGGTRGWYYGEYGDGTDDVWCHKCEGWCHLVAPDKYEVNDGCS